ncbi:MAG: hypothetical protein GY870_02920 [archaeon]|nr:hypothetical protein [archaeon]
MIFETIYMIRNGSFGSEWEFKLVMSLLAVFLCFVDYLMKNKRKDYFWVFIYGTIIWGGVEFVLQLTAERDIHQAFLFGIELPLIIACLFQGMSEGAYVAVLGVFVGDRIINTEKKDRIIGLGYYFVWNVWVIIRTFLQAVSSKDIGGDVASRRAMFTPKAIIFLFIMVVISIYWLWRADKQTRKRGIYMYLVMFIFATIWTIAEFYANTRWIESGTLENLVQAEPLIEFAALAFDVVIEIAGAYVPFLAIPYFTKQIKKGEEKDKIQVGKSTATDVKAT